MGPGDSQKEQGEGTEPGHGLLLPGLVSAETTNLLGAAGLAGVLGDAGFSPDWPLVSLQWTLAGPALVSSVGLGVFCCWGRPPPGVRGPGTICPLHP